MSDQYCPPASSSDYLKSGISYPDSEGKESERSSDVDHNDLDNGSNVTGKTTVSVVTTTEETNKIDRTLQMIDSRFEKAVTALSFSARVTKSISTLGFSSAQRKAVNEI